MTVIGDPDGEERRSVDGLWRGVGGSAHVGVDLISGADSRAHHSSSSTVVIILQVAVTDSDCLCPFVSYRSSRTDTSSSQRDSS